MDRAKEVISSRMEVKDDIIRDIKTNKVMDILIDNGVIKSMEPEIKEEPFEEEKSLGEKD